MQLASHLLDRFGKSKRIVCDAVIPSVRLACGEVSIRQSDWPRAEPNYPDYQLSLHVISLFNVNGAQLMVYRGCLWQVVLDWSHGLTSLYN